MGSAAPTHFDQAHCVKQTDRAIAREEASLGRWLWQQGIKYGVADYWMAYRLSFLFAEAPIVVPLNEGQDRYPPYRRAFRQQRHVAYIFHPSRPAATAKDWEPRLKKTCAQMQRSEIDGFTVLLCDRK